MKKEFFKQRGTLGLIVILILALVILFNKFDYLVLFVVIIMLLTLVMRYKRFNAEEVELDRKFLEMSFEEKKKVMEGR